MNLNMTETSQNKRKRLEWYFCGGMIVVAFGVWLVANKGMHDLDLKRQQSKIDLAAEQFDSCVISVEHPQKVAWCQCYSDRLANFVWDEDRLTTLSTDDFQTIVEAEKIKIGHVCNAITSG